MGESHMSVCSRAQSRVHEKRFRDGIQKRTRAVVLVNRRGRSLLAAKSKRAKASLPLSEQRSAAPIRKRRGARPRSSTRLGRKPGIRTRSGHRSPVEAFHLEPFRRYLRRAGG